MTRSLLAVIFFTVLSVTNICASMYHLPTLVAGSTFPISREIELPSPVYNGVTEMQPGLYSDQSERWIESGSKFITSYSDDCPEELRGAFEYAVKIWEENLPECLPISIKVAYRALPANVPSSVKFRTLMFNRSENADHLYPTTAVKAVLLREFNRNSFLRFCEELPDVSVIERDDDISITYNSLMFDDFSFSLDESDVNGRFDFVSLALRDIARGLGIAPLFLADTVGGTLECEDEPSTPYTDRLYEALGWDPNVAYANATKGQFNANIIGNNYLYYAPPVWVDGLSLSTFIPEANKALSRVLRYDFARGMVMRDLTGSAWTDMFGQLLDWRNDIITGAVQGSIVQGGSTGNIIPFSGSYTIGEDWNDMENMKMASASAGNPIQAGASSKISTLASGEAYNRYAYCRPYSFWINNIKGTVTTVAALLNDGTWDILSTYSQSSDDDTPQPLTLNTDEMIHHYDIESYARTTSGGLRYRIATGTRKFDYLRDKEYYDYDVTYCTREYTPQAAVISYDGYYKPIDQVAELDLPVRNLRRASSTVPQDDDDEYIDVPVRIRNVEGTDYILVVQYDPGENIPFSYDETDFRKGYFMVNVCREGTTRLNIISYNKNGSTKSNPLEISNVGFPDRQISMQRDANGIKFTGIHAITSSKEGAVCTLTDTATGMVVKRQNVHADDNVSLEGIEKGVYLVSLSDGYGKSSTFKIVK